MEIKTKIFGKLNISEEQVIKFSNGLLGFEDYRDFVFLKLPQSEKMYWLQSVREPALGFLAVDPFSFFTGYSVNLTQAVREELAIKKAREVNIYCLVTLPADRKSSITVNLKGPLVINTANNRGKQLVLDDERYSTRQPLALARLKQFKSG